MSDRLVDAFNKLKKRSRWVFPTVSGKRHAHMYKIVERVAEQATIEGAHPHKFRATFLTRLLQSGCDIANVQALAGHKSIIGRMKYSKAGWWRISEDHAAAACRHRHS